MGWRRSAVPGASPALAFTVTARTIVDATIIAAPSSTKNQAEARVQLRFQPSLRAAIRRGIALFSAGLPLCDVPSGVCEDADEHSKAAPAHKAMYRVFGGPYAAGASADRCG
jgi:hypothetical protein